MGIDSFCNRRISLLLLLLSTICRGYVLPARLRIRVQVKPLFGDRFNGDIEERSRQRSQGEGGGEMAAGAILGGLLGGPFGTTDDRLPSVGLLLVVEFISFLYLRRRVIRGSDRSQPWWTERIKACAK
jgi:hypothetical protein